MNGDDGAPSLRRQSAKRSFGVMAASHRDGSPSSLFVGQHDEHYNNEHSAARRRIHISPSVPPRFAGDGLDYRRPARTPAMEEVAARDGGAGRGESQGHVPVIDLTDDDFGPGIDDEEAALLEEQPAAAEGSSADARQRLGRLLENVITLEDDDILSDGDGDLWHGQGPGPIHLALPGPHQRRNQAHPRYSMLRRPARNGEPNQGSGNGVRTSTPTQFQPPHNPHVQGIAQRAGAPQPIDLTEDDEDDDVIITETRQREAAGVNAEVPTDPAGTGNRFAAGQVPGNYMAIADLLRGGGTRLLQRMLPALDALRLPAPNQPQTRAQPQPRANYYHIPPRRHHARTYTAFHRPAPNMQDIIGNMMDYTAAGFNLNMGRATPERQPTPAYSPPPEPMTGFTRTPNEDETIVCPNCGDELAQGESEVKQEVWVIKTCGHAYCGACARNRSRPTAKRSKGKGKGRVGGDDDVDLGAPPSPPPFKKCVVPDCGRPATMNSMIHVYLGS